MCCRDNGHGPTQLGSFEQELSGFTSLIVRFRKQRVKPHFLKGFDELQLGDVRFKKNTTVWDKSLDRIYGRAGETAVGAFTDGRGRRR